MLRAIFVLICVLTSAAGAALAQAPTADQQAAIKANCRSDFMANCMGVPRGGKEALQCLEKNMANLSAGCQQAIKAITAAAPATPPPAAPAATAKQAAPATEPSAASSAPPTTQPSATAAPAPAAPTTVTTPAAPAASTNAVAPAAAPAAAAETTTPAPEAAKKTVTTPQPAAAPPPAAAAAPQVIVVPPRQIFALVRTVCRADYRDHCSDVDIGGGRVVACLQANAASLSPECRNGLASLGR